MTRFGSDDQLRDRTRATWNPAREIAYGFGRRPRGERAVQQHEPATPPHEVAQKRPVARVKGLIGGGQDDLVATDRKVGARLDVEARGVESQLRVVVRPTTEHGSDGNPHYAAFLSVVWPIRRSTSSVRSAAFAQL